MHSDRQPGSIEEARTLVAYNERILASSTSAQRRHRAERMLANLRPHIARLEREEAERVRRIQSSAPPAPSFEERPDDSELEPTWNGTMGRAGKSLTDGQGLGSSLAPGPGFPVHR